MYCTEDRKSSLHRQFGRSVFFTFVKYWPYFLSLLFLLPLPPPRFFPSRIYVCMDVVHTMAQSSFDLDSADRPFDNIINFRDVGSSINALCGSRYGSFDLSLVSCVTDSFLLSVRIIQPPRRGRSLP